MNLWSLDVGSRHRIQTLKETPAKIQQPQLTKPWAVAEEVFDSLQLWDLEQIRQQPTTNLQLALSKTNS